MAISGDLCFFLWLCDGHGGFSWFCLILVDFCGGLCGFMVIFFLNVVDVYGNLWWYISVFFPGFNGDTNQLEQVLPSLLIISLTFRMICGLGNGRKTSHTTPREAKVGHLGLSGNDWESSIASSMLEMGMDQYLLIPFLVGWTSIYQLFWGSLGTRVLTHPQICSYFCWGYPKTMFRPSGWTILFAVSVASTSGVTSFNFPFFTGSIWRYGWNYRLQLVGSSQGATFSWPSSLTAASLWIGAACPGRPQAFCGSERWWIAVSPLGSESQCWAKYGKVLINPFLCLFIKFILSW